MSRRVTPTSDAFDGKASAAPAGVGIMPRDVRSNSAAPMLSSSWRTAMLTAGCVMPRLSATDGMWCCSVSATNARTRRSCVSMPNIAASPRAAFEQLDTELVFGRANGWW